MSFRKKITVYFDQGDPANIAFHGEHPVIAQRVFEEYVVKKFDIPWDSWFRNPKFIMPIVKLHTDYKKPLHPGKDYFVDVMVSRVGRSSVHCSYKIFTLKEEECCSIEASYVCVDKESFKSRPLPEEWISILKKNCPSCN